MLHVRSRRSGLFIAVIIGAISLAGCDMSLLALSPNEMFAQKSRVTRTPASTATNRAAVAVPTRNYRLGSGDKLGAASYAIYCEETLLAGPAR